MRRASDVYADLLRQAMKPNSLSYSALVSACEKGTEMRRSFDVSADMLRQAAGPNSVSYSAAQLSPL